MLLLSQLRKTSSSDLESVIIGGRIFKQSVVGVKHFLGQQIEPLPGHAAVVKPDLAVKLYPELRLEGVHFVGGNRMNLTVRVLQNSVPPHLNIGNIITMPMLTAFTKCSSACLYFYLVGNITRFLELLFEVFILPLVISAVGHGLARDLRVGDAGVLPLRHPVVVVDEEDPAVGVDSLLPALGQGTEVVVVSPVSRASNEDSRRFHNHI